MKTKARKPKRIQAKPKVQFTCMVDAELLAQANQARMTTWVHLVEGMMQDLVDRESKR